MRRLIRGGWIIGYQADKHHLLRDGEVVWEDDRILYVGPRFEGTVDATIDARGKLVSPGFVNAHAIGNIDVQTMSLDQPGGLLSKPETYMHEETSIAPSDDELRTSAEFAVAGLLKGGSTTFATVTTMAINRWEGPEKEAETLAETVGRLGGRAYLSHNYRSGTLYRDRHGVGRYSWDEARGRAGLEHAIAFIERYHNTFDGRVQGMLFPYTADSCSPALLRATREAADSLGVRIHIHTAQYLAEFHEILARHGRTPIQYLDQFGLVAPDVILTHVIHTTANPLSGFPADDDRDLRLIRDRGAHVAHCPVVYARINEVMASFSRYRRMGINVAIGTDTFPPDIIEEIRAATWLNKVIDRDRTAASAGEVYEAVTLGGARALGRADIGRLSSGAKADIVIIDLSRFDLGPLDDPVQTLVHCANRRDVETVISDGRIVVEGGKLRGLDEAALVARARQVYRNVKERIVARFWPGRTEEELFPNALPAWRGE